MTKCDTWAGIDYSIALASVVVRWAICLDAFPLAYGRQPKIIPAGTPFQISGTFWPQSPRCPLLLSGPYQCSMSSFYL